MDKTTRHLLEVLADLYEDGVMHDTYGIEDDSSAPLEVALRDWSAAGFPDATSADIEPTDDLRSIAGEPNG